VSLIFFLTADSSRLRLTYTLHIIYIHVRIYAVLSHVSSTTFFQISSVFCQPHNQPWKPFWEVRSSRTQFQNYCFSQLRQLN